MKTPFLLQDWKPVKANLNRKRTCAYCDRRMAIGPMVRHERLHAERGDKKRGEK